MASVCKKQQCTIDRRGFRQELDSWRHKLIHCVGFESILEGLIGPELLEDLKVLNDFEPVAGSDWSFKENCLFCCLRRDKVKEHLIGLNKGGLDDTSKPLLVKDQLTIIRLEKQAEEFLRSVLSRKDAPNFSDPHVPVVAREILQKMISQLAAEYTSKPSSPQDSRSDSPPRSDQSLPAPLLLSGAPPTTPAATLVGPAHNQNPVLSKLLMADQDAPLDLTVKKPLAEPAEQDGVLDLSIKKNRYSSSSLPGCFSPTTSTPKRRSLSVDGQVGLFRRSLQDGRRRENFGHSASNNPTSSLAYSLHIKEEANLEIDPESPLSYNPRSSPTELLRNASSSSSNSKTHFGALLKLKTSSGADKHLKDIPRLLEAAGLFPNSLSTEKGNLKDACKDQSLSLSRSSSFDLKIPQVRVLATGAETSWDSLSTEYSGSTCENGFRKNLCAILPRQIQKRSSVGSNSSGSEKDYWPFPSDHQSSGASYSMDSESDPGNKQPRKKRGRYRQYNTELLEEAILVVMGGKMSVSKAQSIYGIPHSTLEYKVKERLGTLKHPPKKKMKLISQMDNQPQSPEGQELLMFQNIDPEEREKAAEDSGTVLHDGDVLSNDESPDFRVAKVKDLKSTSTLEQFMAKLCSHHQRQIVDAIGFLQMEVKAHASSKASNIAPGAQGTACFDEKSSRAIPDKSPPVLKLPGESTPEAKPHELSHSVPKSCALKTIPENAVSLKSSADSALDIFSFESENNQPLNTVNLIDGEDNRPSDHVPLRMKIMASNAAAGKKLSCVLDGNFSSQSETFENNQSNTNSFTRVETHSARLSTPVKRHSQMSLIHQVRQLEVFEHPKNTPAKVFPVHVTIPSDSARTARKTTRTLSEHQIRDSICREIVDPDFGHCDIVFIDKPITECFNKKRRSMVPRRNARKSTRGHMYSDEIWELKTVRTLAGRGNCPNPMPELITLISPKQILSKPEGVPPVDMPFVGVCTETMNQQKPTEESDESLTPGAGDDVEVAASKADVVVEMSQTDPCQNKGLSNTPSPSVLPTENRETLADTYAEQEAITDSGMTIQNAEVIDQLPHDATKGNGPEAHQVIHDNTEPTVSGTELEPLEIIATEEAESSSDKLNSEPLPKQNNTSSAVSQTEKEMEEDKVEKIQDVQLQEPQPETQTHDDNLEESEMLTTTSSTEEPIEKQTKIQPPEATESLTPVATKTDDDNDASKSLDEPIKKMRRKKGTKMLPQGPTGQDETVIVGYVNGKPVSASDRSLRHRAGSNSISPSKPSRKSSQNGPNEPNNTVPDLNIELPAENKNLEKLTPQTEPQDPMEAPPVKEQLTEHSSDTISSPASKLPSKTRDVHHQKSVLRSSVPVHSDKPDNQAQSTTPKRQLRSTSQKPLATPLPPTSNLTTSISSPKPSTLVLPPAEQLPPLLLPYPLPITMSLVNRSSESSVPEHPKQNTHSKTVEGTQPAEAISEDPHSTQPTDVISEDTHNTQLTDVISEDTHSSQPTDVISEDTHGSQPTDVISKDAHNTQPIDVISEDVHNTQPIDVISEDTHNTQPTDVISKDTRNTQPTDVISKDTHNTQPTDVISEDTHNTQPIDVISKDTHNTQPIDVISEDTHDTQPSDVISEDTHDTQPSDVISEDTHDTQPSDVISEDTHDTQPTDVISEDTHDTQPSDVISEDTHDTQPTDVISEDTHDTQPTDVISEDTHNAELTDVISKETHNTQPTDVISEDTYNTQPTDVISEDTHNTQPTDVISEDTHNTQPTDVISEDTHNTQPTDVISEDTHNTQPTDVISEDTHNTQPIEAIPKDTQNTQPTDVISKDRHNTQPTDVISKDSHNTQPTDVISEDIHNTQAIDVISEDKRNTQSIEAISEDTHNTKPIDVISEDTHNTQQLEDISEDTHKPKIVKGSETKHRLRSAKAVTGNNKNDKEHLGEESNPSKKTYPVKTEAQTESVPVRSKRVLRKNPDAGYVGLIQKKNGPSLEDKSAVGDNNSTPISDKPTRMPLRSETIKIEMSNQSDIQSPPPNKKLALRSQKFNAPSAALTETQKLSNVAFPVRVKPERTHKAQTRPNSVSVAAFPQNIGLPLITPKHEPPKQMANKFLQALTGEQNQHLITNLSNKYDKMLKGWVQMDKEGQPAAKYKNKSDRQAAIWKSKRRVRKSKSSEQQKYSPVQMLFMKGFDLTSICHWFLESTETKSLVIVKKVNTRLPSETQLCFHSSSVSGPSQGVFPSIQAERLKKHLKKFAIASPVKSNPKSLKLIAKALEQEANAVKGKERTELPSSTQSPSKSPSSAKACAQKNESPKSSGNKNPASARILRKYSNIREKMQVQHTTVRLKKASKLLKNKKLKTLAATKSTAKSKLKPSLKGQKSTILVSKKMKESAAKLKRRKILAAKRSKYSVKKKAGKAQAGRTSRSTSKKELPKRSSQRLGSPKISDHNSVDTLKSKVGSKKQNEADKPELEKSEVNKVNSVKIQATESCQSTSAEAKGCENSADVVQQVVGVKAPVSPDQVLTRSQRKMEAEVPPSGSPSNVSKRATKSKSSHKASSKAATEVDEPKLTRSGASKRCQTSLLPHNVTKGATKRAHELRETPAKRARTK